MSAYCDAGHTSSGVEVHDGAAAWNAAPRGSRWRVVAGPPEVLGRVFTILDTSSRRFSHRMDAWMASCEAAIRFGVPFVEVEPA